MKGWLITAAVICSIVFGLVLLTHNGSVEKAREAVPAREHVQENPTLEPRMDTKGNDLQRKTTFNEDSDHDMVGFNERLGVQIHRIPDDGRDRMMQRAGRAY